MWEVSHFCFSKNNQQELFQHTYIRWYCHPSSPAGKLMNVLPDILLHKQVDEKLLRQRIFHAHSNWIYDTSGLCKNNIKMTNWRYSIEYLYFFPSDMYIPDWWANASAPSLMNTVSLSRFSSLLQICPILGRPHTLISSSGEKDPSYIRKGWKRKKRKLVVSILFWFWASGCILSVQSLQLHNLKALIMITT